MSKGDSMILEIHDTEEGNTLSGKVNSIEYDYLAEQWVQDLLLMRAKGKSPSTESTR